MPYSPTASLQGKVIAITGGASGIGLATTHLLASRGASLSLADLNDDALKAASTDIISEHNVEVLTFPLDVRKSSEVDAWISATISKFGKLDGGVNLAGVIPKSIGLDLGGIAEMDEDEWDFVIGVNLTGVMHYMRAQMKVISNGGSIVNAVSIAGVTGRPNNGAYAASKHGVVGLTRSAAKEIGGKGVRVNSIAPGSIVTPMTMAAAATDLKTKGEAVSVPLGRQGVLGECASLIAFLLSDEATYITGATYSVDGGWNC